LGDYLNMGKVEQEVLPADHAVLRLVRAIVRITAHLAIDTPGRANILTKLGQIGDVSTQDALGPLPDYLLNLIPLGHGDHPTVASTKGANPFATVIDLGSGVKGSSPAIRVTPGRRSRSSARTRSCWPRSRTCPAKTCSPATTSTAPAGLWARLRKSTAEQLPQVALIKALLGHGRRRSCTGSRPAGRRLSSSRVCR
jgi:hypothetical protein